MKDASVPILILENDLLLSEMIRDHLQLVLPQVVPFLARTIAEANVFIYQYEFSAFLIDIGLPDGSGLDFIVDLKTVLPQSRILIMTGLSFEEIRQNLEHLGVGNYLLKPFDILELEQRILNMLSEVVKRGSFHGSLRQMRLVDLIQLKCLSGDSCRLMITGPAAESGTVTICQGVIQHAETATYSGIQAFNNILSWKSGFFHEAEFESTNEINVTGHWEMILMEAVRQSDECYALEAI